MSLGKPPECHTEMCFLELSFRAHPSCLGASQRRAKQDTTPQGLGASHPLGVATGGQRDTTAAAMHCLYSCKGRTPLSERPSVDEECTRPAYMCMPDRALKFPCYSRNYPHCPSEMHLPCLGHVPCKYSCLLHRPLMTFSPVPSNTQHERSLPVESLTSAVRRSLASMSSIAL